MKLDMSKWKQAQVGVLRSLKLDPNNVRLGLPAGASQREVIAALYSTEDALALAKSIVNVGWLTFEFPIALKDASGYVVVEGNRRIAALKGLIQPSLVPEYQARLEKLSQQTDVDSLKRIKVTLAPGLPEADMLIAAIHTGNLRKGWGRARQAVFFERLLEDGYSAQELVDRFPTVEVRDLLRRGSMRRLFLGGLRQNPELFDYFNAPRTPMTILERLTDNPDFLKMAKITVDSESLQASTMLDAGAFESVAEKIVTDMKNGVIDTRVLNGPELSTYQKYVSDLETIIDGARVLGRQVDAAANSRSSESMDQSKASSPAKGSLNTGNGNGVDASSAILDGQAKISTRVSVLLNFSGVVVSEELPQSIGIITKELKGLNYRKFPNATYDLLRSYLEKCIQAYAQYCGAEIPPKKPGQSVGLEACLLWLEEHTKNSQNGLKNYHHPVQLLRDQKAQNRSSTLGLMNSVNHNPEVVVQSDHVFSLWAHLHGIVKFLVNPNPILKLK